MATISTPSISIAELVLSLTNTITDLRTEIDTLSKNNQTLCGVASTMEFEIESLRRQIKFKDERIEELETAIDTKDDTE